MYACAKIILSFRIGNFYFLIRVFLLVFVIRTITWKRYFLSAVNSQKEEFKCPDEYGFYPHNQHCDKYWKCDGNVAELKTCGNGLAFEDSDPKYLKENCDYLHNVDCGQRNLLGTIIKFYAYIYIFFLI